MPDLDYSNDEINARTDGPIHTWFGLSYSNYQVLHRSLMQSMPVEWQQRMVACLEELDSAYANIDRAPGYEVRACEWLAPYDMGLEQMRLAGVTCSDDDPDNPEEGVYYDRDGHELDGEIGRVPVPAREPIPHYNRGRTFIPPHEAGGSHA